MLNPIHKALGHQFPITYGIAPYYFKKGNSIQRIMHQLKYGGDTSIGKQIGCHIGQHMKRQNKFGDIDFLIPVPLHFSKLESRGYNQSQIIGKSIANYLSKPLITDILFRKHSSKTQTHKSRFNRWKSTQSAFILKDKITLIGKHVAIVDDVFTTGATLSGCLQALESIKRIKISVITAAIADY